MAYIGKTPQVGNYQKCDALNASATADYTLQVSSTLSFASALTSNDTIDFVILLGNVLDIGTPSDDTVSTAKIQDDAVTSAKLGTGDMTFPNGDLIFGTAGKGVCLGVTSNTDSNTLDDYEEGTFTPTVIGSTSGSFTTGDSATTGSYVKIGSQVTIRGEIHITSSSSPVGSLKVANLPFTCADLTELSERTTGSCWVKYMDIVDDVASLNPVIGGGNTHFNFYETRDDNNISTIQSDEVTVPNAEFAFCLTYQAA